MRVHVVSDVHGNVEALARAGAGADALLVLGDLIDFVDYHDHSEQLLTVIRRDRPRAALFGHVHQPLASRVRVGRTECVNVGYFRRTGTPYVIRAAVVSMGGDQNPVTCRHGRSVHPVHRHQRRTRGDHGCDRRLRRLPAVGIAGEDG